MEQSILVVVHHLPVVVVHHLPDAIVTLLTPSSGKREGGSHHSKKGSVGKTVQI